MKYKNLGLIAGIITIFTFLTGINSLPALLNIDTSGGDTGLIGAGVNRSLSLGLLVLSQVAYYISFYSIMRKVKKKYYPKEVGSSITENYIHSLSRHQTFFFFIVSFLFGIGISFLFMEAIWNPIPKLIEDAQFGVLIGFGMFSIAGNLITVWNAYEIQT